MKATTPPRRAAEALIGLGLCAMNTNDLATAARDFTDATKKDPVAVDAWALLGQIAGRAGEVVVFPLWPGQGRPASRIIVRARKQVASPARLAVGMVLHEADGRFSEAAEAVLRGGQALVL